MTEEFDRDDCWDWVSSRWHKLTDEDCFDVVSEVHRLLCGPRLYGGPYDGYRLTAAEDEERLFYSAHVDSARVAIYEEDHDGRLVFTKYRKKGEGCHADLFPDEAGAL